MVDACFGSIIAILHENGMMRPLEPRLEVLADQNEEEGVMKRKALLTMGVLAGISFAAQGWAVPVTYIAEGSLTTQYQGDSNFFPFMPGDKFIFSYSFDDAIDLNNLSGTSEFSPTDLFFRIAGQGYDYSTTNLISGVVAHTENPDSVGMYANSYSVIGGNISLNSAYIIMRDIHNLVLGSPVGVLPITVTKDDFEFSSYQILFSTVVGSETKTLT